MSDDPLTTCEECGGALRRVLFPPAVVYKGTGFYTTDYKNGGRKDAAKSEEAKPDSATSSSTEAKAETKTDASTSDTSGPKKEPAATS
jgi:predicted nucleic acid-binding Zn ribbon protein